MATLETIANYITGGRIEEQADMIAELQQSNSQAEGNLVIMRESMSRLERAFYSPNWRSMAIEGEREFTREGLRMIVTLARLMRLKNPIIKRGVDIQRLYVWARGVSISSVDEEVNQVVQGFLRDNRNRSGFTSHQARSQLEVDLQTDGNVFIRFFVNQATGRVRVRAIDSQEIDRIIFNPEDSKQPWFYRRTWAKQMANGSAIMQIEYYPDWQFIPQSRARAAQSVPLPGGRVVWNTPVEHIAVNRNGAWGVPEFYDAMDWAFSYKTFLERLASVWQVLARWAAKLTKHTSPEQIAANKKAMGTTRDVGGGVETNRPPLTGSVALLQGDMDLQPFRTNGVTMKAEDGRRLFLMAIMSFGFSESFYGDAKSGSLATAKSLDRPTELRVQDRQTLWGDFYTEVLDYVTLWAVKAPLGPLRNQGRVVRVIDDGQVIEVVDWNEGVDAMVQLNFPAIIEHDLKATIDALVDGQTLMGRAPGQGTPLEATVRKLLVEGGFTDVDALMTAWREEQEALPTQTSSGNDEDGEDDEDGELAESVFQRQQEEVARLLTALAQSALGQAEGNGHV